MISLEIRFLEWQKEIGCQALKYRGKKYGGWLGVLYKNCPLYKMNSNIFFSSVNCYCVKKKKKGQHLQTFPSGQREAHHCLILCSCTCLRFGGWRTTYWNPRTISYSMWIITLGLQLKCWPEIALLLSPHSIISLNDMVLGLVLRKGNWTHIWKRLVQRGRAESVWWEKYK